MSNRIVEDGRRNLVNSGVVKGTHGFLEEILCGWVEVTVSHVMEGSLVLECSTGIVGVEGVRGMGRWISEVLHIVSWVVEGDDCKLLLDRGEHGLPNG